MSLHIRKQITAQAWLRMVQGDNYVEQPIVVKVGIMPSIESIKKSEWSDTFEHEMRKRLWMGAFRYGLLHAPNKPKWNRIDSIKKRVEIYEQTGNLDYLVDIANLCLLEFEEGEHPLKHMKSIDDGHHVTL